MRKALRSLLRIQPTVTADRAIESAKQVCAERGWPWSEPVATRESLRDIRVWTNSGHRGGNVIIRIDIESGELKHASYAER